MNVSGYLLCKYAYFFFFKIDVGVRAERVVVYGEKVLKRKTLL